MKRIKLLAFTLGCFLQLFSQTNYYVANTGHDTNNNGLAVGTPFLTIAKAISTAASGDIINIAAGMYTEKLVFSKSLTISGAGIGSTIVQAAASLASGNGIVFTLDAAYTSATTITIQNMTIQNGYGTNSAGGVRLNNTGSTLPNLNLTNLKIINNSGTNGGGIYIQGGVNLTVDGCYITGNTARTVNGGGVAIGGTGTNGAYGITLVKNSTIASNTATAGNGAGINIWSKVSYTTAVTIQNSTIYGNTNSTSAKTGPGIYCNNYFDVTSGTLNLTVNHCTIANNTTTGSTGLNGDGISLNKSTSATNVGFIMNNSIVRNNGSSSASQVDGSITNNGVTNSIFTYKSSATWQNSGTFTNNDVAGTSILAFAGSLSSDATPVLAIGNGSIARNYIQTNFLSPALTLDQIGNARVGNTDVGAFENQSTICSVQAANDGNGSVSGTGNVTLGNPITLTATPNPGFAFSAFTVTSGTATFISANPLTFTPTADCTITASFTSITALTPTVTYARTASTIDVLVTNPTGYNGTITYNVLDVNDNVLASSVAASGQTATLVYSALGLTANTTYTYKVIAVINGSINSATAILSAITRKFAPTNGIQVIDDFADNTMGWTGQNSPVITIPFTNTITSGINASASCAKVNIVSGKANYTGLQNSYERIEIGPNAPYQYLHVKMYRDADNGTIGLTFLARRDISQAQFASDENLTVSTVSASGPWVYYVFDLKNAAYTSDKTIFGFYIKPNRTSSNTNVASNSYIDDVYLSNSVPVSSGTTNAADIVCTTCDVTVASGGELTVGANKTLKSVTVAAGGKITLTAGTLNATNGITLESNENGTATMLQSGTLTGTVIAKQYLGSARNWYISSPVASAPSPSNNMDYYYEYVEAGDNNPAGQPGSSTVYWKGLANGTTMEIGKGYIAKTNAGATVQFSGTPNNGNITTAFNLTRNDAKGRGFNLVGNPYPSYIDWSLVATANPNLDNTYYYRTKNNASSYTFVTWNGAGSNYVVSNGSLAVSTTVTRYIPPTQAFWVRVKSGTASTAMSFTNTMRAHRDDNGNIMKAPKQDTRTSIRLQLQNGTESDEVLIYQDAAASNSFDAFDSPKMMNNSATVPDLYSKVNDERLVINGLNAITDNMELPLGFSLNAAASLRLKATEISNFPIGTRIYLLDKVETTQVELLPETEYNFTTTAATTNNEGRFSLLFKAPATTTGIENAGNENTTVFVNAVNQITIIAPEKSNYAVYNAVGQQIEKGVLNTELQTVNCKLQTGIFVVKVNNQSTRVIIK